MTEPAAGRRSPTIAALLSFVLPGLGHLYLGRPRTALVYALPVLGVFLSFALRVATDGLDVIGVEMLSPSLSLTVLGIAVVLGLWWLVALIDAFYAAGGRRPWRAGPTALVVALILAIASVSSYSAYDAWAFYDAGQHIFVGNGPDSATPAPGSPGASGVATARAGPSFADATPLTTPAPGSHRITVLLTGIDSSPTVDHALNDTMIVVSLDTTTGKVAMVSFARDIASFKLWNGQTYGGKINSLMTYAQANPSQFKLGGMNTLVKELSFLLGIPIDYYAAVNLPGFTDLVDAVGGVTVYNDTVIADPSYGGWTDKRPLGFYLSVGNHTLDGQSALAYARSRMGPNNNDFVRARRQQQLIVALEQKLASPSMLPQLPGIIRALGNTVRTNYPADNLGQILNAVKQVSESNITKVVLGPPYAVRSNDPTTYSLTLDMSRLAALSVSLFGSDSAYAAVGQAPSPSP